MGTKLGQKEGGTSRENAEIVTTGSQETIIKKDLGALMMSLTYTLIKGVTFL